MLHFTASFLFPRQQKWQIQGKETLAEIQQGHQVRKSLLGYTAALMGTCLRQAVLHLPTVCSAGGIPYLSTSEDLPGGSSGCSYTIAK